MLCYGMKGGITYGDIQQMEPEERQGYLDWLHDQLDREHSAIKQAQSGRGRARKK